MLSWLSHEASREQQPQNSNDDEAPETPAHLFPVRAFKHAIFGTPAPPKTNRRPVHTKHQERPRSRDKEVLASSPSKRPGILLTPGTGGQKRKSVSFGGPNQKEARNDATSKVANDTASKYPPSPAVEDAEDSQVAVPFNSNFVQRLRVAANEPQEDTTLDMTAPRSTSGKYWKGEFENYSVNTERQLKKLAKKEQVAKKIAQMKVSESQQLEEDLQQEQTRAIELERKVQLFRRQLESQLQGSGNVVGSSGDRKDEELERLRKENELLRAQLKAQSLTPMELPSNSHDVRPHSRDRPTLGRATTDPMTFTPPIQQSERAGHPRRRPQSPRKDQPSLVKDSSDIWADAGGSNVESKEPVPSELRRQKAREPLAQRNNNADSRSSSTAGILGTNKLLKVPEEDKEVVSRSSSTAGILGSRQASCEGTEKRASENPTATQGSGASNKSATPADRQAAARERLERRKREKDRASKAANTTDF